MKAKTFPLVIALVFSVLFLPGCSVCGDGPVIGIIETSGSEKTSRLALFDENLNKVLDYELEEASLNSIFYDPVIDDGILYVIPQGYAQEKNTKKIVGVNLQNGESEEYPIDRPAMNSVAKSEQFIFTCNTLDGVSSINRYDMKSGQVTSIDEAGTYVSHLMVKDDILYSFASSLDGESSWIDCCDLDLNQLNRVDISEYGSGVYRSSANGSGIYFIALVAGDGSSNGTLLKFDTVSGELDEIAVPSHPIDVEFHSGKMYVTHGNMVEGTETSSLTVVDGDGTVEEVKRFSHGALQTVVNDNGVYILDNRTIYRYSIGDLEGIDKVTLSSFWNQYHYISGLFSMGE